MGIVRQLGLGGLALVVASMAASGCGRDPNALATVPAAGTVTYLGKPLETGNILFIPEKGRSASGVIKDGHFTLTTYELDDGAIPGTHQVTVTATKEVPSTTGGEPKVVHLIPVAYSSPSDSGLTAEVPPGGSKDIKIELKSVEEVQKAAGTSGLRN